MIDGVHNQVLAKSHLDHFDNGVVVEGLLGEKQGKKAKTATATNSLRTRSSPISGRGSLI
jgi:hypothetical protein